MPYLLDSNILVRLAHRPDPDNLLVRNAVRTLLNRGERLSFTSQNLMEVWNVSTRPTTARGGMGLSLTETDRRTRLIERYYSLLDDVPAVHQEWRRLVVAHGVSGVQVYDTRLAAFMLVYRIPSLLTFNAADFTRYGVLTVHPATV